MMLNKEALMLNKETVIVINKQLIDRQVTFVVQKEENSKKLVEMRGTVVLEPHKFSSHNTVPGVYDLFCYTDAGIFSITLDDVEKVSVSIERTSIMVQTRHFTYLILFRK
jgi:hypothetical protein